jgi:hypothetical protein
LHEPTTKFKEIPRGPLLKKLEQKGGRIARSDDTAEVTGFTRERDVYTDTIVAV